MTQYLGNAFSLQMVTGLTDYTLKVTEITAAEVPDDVISCVGHPDTANVLSHLFGRTVACQRVNVNLQRGDTLYVAQLTGGRLPEGTTTLPEGFVFRFYRVMLC